MYRERSLEKLFVLTGLIILCCPNTPAARQNSLIGGIGVGYTFWERSYDDESTLLDPDTGDIREMSAWPDFELRSVGIHDVFSLHYTPVLTYDDLDSETDVDHYLTAGWQQQMTRKWSLDITDDFVFSSDPTRSESPFADAGEEVVADEQPITDELSTNLGSRRYWTNRLGLSTVYTYAVESTVEVGYGYRILRNDSGSSDEFEYDEYDRHGFTGLWGHRYTPTWRSQFGLQYYDGIFDDLDDDGLSQDLQEYRLDARVDYNKQANTTFPLIYRYQSVEYENLRDDIWGHEVTLRWDYAIDARNNLIIGAGPSYAESEDLGGELGYNLYFNYTKTYQHGRFGALVDKRYISRNFTGTNDGGLVDVADFRLDANYQMTPDVSFDVFGLYRYEEILNPDGEYYTAALAGGDPAVERDLGDITYTRKGFSTGASVNYSFLRWFVASLRYVYYQRDGDVATDAYDDHRVFVQLTARKELWR